MKVFNLTSPRGNQVPNQFEIFEGSKRIFQSYNAVICIVDSDSIVLDEYYWNYSQTTSKYRNIFLGETTKETERKIKQGIYKLANLN